LYCCIETGAEDKPLTVQLRLRVGAKRFPPLN